MARPIPIQDQAVAGDSPTSDQSLTSEMEESALQHLDVDDDDDRDSAIGGMTRESSTASAQSSIYDYVEENGRTYHRYKEGKYMLPNDETERDRLDLQHMLWMLTLGDQLFLAPVKEPQTVLDFGTGTGIWAIEFADRYPASQVIGSDLSPIQPEYVPPNCVFEVDDVEDEWNYSQNFDLIHGRAMATCFKDPEAVIKSAFDSLVPGGYFELQDAVLPMRSIDDTLRGTAFENFFELMLKAAKKLGRSWEHSVNYVRYFEEAGFVDIVERHFQWPINTWARGEHMKILGTYFQEDLNKALDGLGMAVLTRGGGMSKEEVLVMAAEVRKDLVNKSIHAYMPIVVVYGRRPD